MEDILWVDVVFLVGFWVNGLEEDGSSNLLLVWEILISYISSSMFSHNILRKYCKNKNSLKIIIKYRKTQMPISTDVDNLKARFNHGVTK